MLKSIVDREVAKLDLAIPGARICLLDATSKSQTSVRFRILFRTDKWILIAIIMEIPVRYPQLISYTTFEYSLLQFFGVSFHQTYRFEIQPGKIKCSILLERVII